MLWFRGRHKQLGNADVALDPRIHAVGEEKEELSISNVAGEIASSRESSGLHKARRSVGEFCGKKKLV